MLRITSLNSFKTCYIANIKEELGLLTRKAPNRQGESRKIKAPKEYKKFILQAIKELEREGVKQTYKNIQKKAFEIYQRQKNDLIDKYFNVIKPNKNLSDTEIKNIIENEDILYED